MPLSSRDLQGSQVGHVLRIITSILQAELLGNSDTIQDTTLPVDTPSLSVFAAYRIIHRNTEIHLAGLSD